MLVPIRCRVLWNHNKNMNKLWKTLFLLIARRNVKDFQLFQVSQIQQLFQYNLYIAYLSLIILLIYQTFRPCGTNMQLYGAFQSINGFQLTWPNLIKIIKMIITKYIMLNRHILIFYLIGRSYHKQWYFSSNHHNLHFRSKFHWEPHWQPDYFDFRRSSSKE